MPPSGQVAAQAAYTDSVSFPWFPIAGHNRGVLDADEVEWSPDRDDRAILAAGQNRVNPIVDFVGQGPTLFDNWTLQRTPTALDQVHVRRLLLHAEKLCATAVKYLVFEPHDPVTWKRFTQLCNTELSAIAASRGLETFKVICDESTNPASQRANKVMKGKLLMVPINAVRELVMDFAVYASGTEFEEEL
jgi:phage tail sheath protein FI